MTPQSAQILDFQVLDRREDHGRDEIDIIADVCERFEGIQKRGAAGAHKPRGFARDDSAVRQLDGDRRVSGLLRFFARGRNCLSHRNIQMQRVHQHFLLMKL